ncbi:hypothetical protein [Pararhizobium polonicum]|uniref:hypothetical protein n=1 Tax=Pararhizobium polonicum TaxID=1612624 RepID=UPI001874F4F6|nr:hypothetical protein [Pararhizobium polonicum]
MLVLLSLCPVRSALNAIGWKFAVRSFGSLSSIVVLHIFRMRYAAGDVVAGEMSKCLLDQRCSAVIACTDPNKQESVILLPEREV